MSFLVTIANRFPELEPLITRCLQELSEQLMTVVKQKLCRLILWSGYNWQFTVVGAPAKDDLEMVLSRVEHDQDARLASAQYLEMILGDNIDAKIDLTIYYAKPKTNAGYPENVYRYCMEN